MPNRGDNLKAAIREAVTGAIFTDLACYTPKGYPHPSSKSREVYGEYKQEFVEIDGVESLSWIFKCQAADVADRAHGARLTVDDTDHTIEAMQPDRIGFVVLILRKR